MARRTALVVFGLCAVLGAAVIVRVAVSLGKVGGSAALEVGTPVQRELFRTARHVFEVALNAGEYAHVTVEQRGIDVVVHLLDSAGRTVADFDAESRTVGSESFGVVADAATTYRLEVTAVYQKYARGRYGIRLDEKRHANETDRNVFEAHRLQTEAARLESAGKYQPAQDLLTRALKLGESAAGPNDSYVAYLLTRLAEIDRNRGDQATAEQLFRQAIAIDDKALGHESPQTAYALLRLSALYNVKDDFARAEPLAEESLGLTERTLGSDHPRVASCLLVVALVHSRRDNFDRAIPELQRGLAIAERTLFPDDTGVVSIEGNLGDLYALQKDFDRAEPLLTRALESTERTYGRDHVRVAVPLQNLGTVAREKKQYARALDLLQRAQAIREQVYGPANTQTAVLRINIGNVYSDLGDHANALANYQKALAVLETSAGPYHQYTIDALSSLANRYAGDGDIARAIEYQARLDRVLEKNAELNLAIGSERDKLAYFDSTLQRMGRTISLQGRKPADGALTNLAATAVLQRKGRVLDAMAGGMATLRQRMNQGDRDALDRLTAVSAQVASLALGGRGSTPADAYQARLGALEQQRDRLEHDISSRSAAFRAQSTPVTLARVSAAIPEAAALLEFAVYRPFDPNALVDSEQAAGEPRYAVYVIQPHREVQWADLGPAAPIDASVHALRQALRDPADQRVRDLARAIDEKVFRPIRTMVSVATRLLVSPDGELNLVPFEALLDENGRYAVERFSISYLTSGRDLLRLEVPRPEKREAIVLADPDFGDPTSAQPRLTQASLRRSVTIAPDLSALYFAPLAGTADEARAIKTLFPDATLLTGTHASKSALAHIEAPRILHIATHGFFLDDPDRPAQPSPAHASATLRGIAARPADIRNPLLRSGLALTGANLTALDDDSGVLTALEAANLNLWGTRLVTLSACDTGVGEIRVGEGVYGLRRAFFLAGAETLVMSLWPINDTVTREIMTAYYTGLKQGRGRGDALREAQLALLARKNRQHPFYWASFIQAGEWTTLDGRR